MSLHDLVELPIAYNCLCILHRMERKTPRPSPFDSANCLLNVVPPVSDTPASSRPSSRPIFISANRRMPEIVTVHHRHHHHHHHHKTFLVRL